MQKFKIEPVDGFSNHIGILVSEMHYVRKNTYELVRNLSIEQLDHYIDDKSNSIGTLLMHIAALEFQFQIYNFYYRTFSKKELEIFWGALPGNMIFKKIKGNPLDFYLDKLTNIRARTLIELRAKDDSWLFGEVKRLKKFSQVNNYYLLRHLADDELTHQGQIKWILQRL